MKLNNLNINLKKKKIRPGRGIGSGKGKTGGRGHKGQKSRSGVAIKSFEGGQMPLYRRLPKRGFKSRKNKFSTAINLSLIENLINSKKLSENEQITLELLQKKKIINKKYNKLKILGTGEINKKINIQINKISLNAKSKIEKQGGQITLIDKTSS